MQFMSTLTIFLIFIISCILPLVSSESIILQLERNITVMQNSQHLITIQQIPQISDNSHQQVFFSSSVSVFRRYPIDSSVFDTFLLEGGEETVCYWKAISNYNQMQCPFLSSSQQSQVRVNNVTLSIQEVSPLESLDAANLTFIIDNTQFPSQGAFYQANLQLQTIFSTSLEVSNEYYNLFIKCLIVCCVVSACIILWTIILYCKVRGIRNKLNSKKQDSIAAVLESQYSRQLLVNSDGYQQPRTAAQRSSPKSQTLPPLKRFTKRNNTFNNNKNNSSNNYNRSNNLQMEDSLNLGLAANAY